MSTLDPQQTMLPTLHMRRKYIYDFAQRALHWWLALGTLFLMVTGVFASYIEPGTGQSQLWGLHMNAGKFLAVGFVGRILWGIVGPTHARFKAFMHLAVWIQSLKARKMISADSEFGHHPQASISYLGFYGLLSAMIVTGFLLSAIMHGEGPLAESFLDEYTYVELFREVHELGLWAIGFFIVTHVGALVFHEWHDRIPIAQSMISGFQYRSKKEEN